MIFLLCSGQWFVLVTLLCRRPTPNGEHRQTPHDRHVLVEEVELIDNLPPCDLASAKLWRSA